jgi:ATP-dependent DNA ligase
LDGQAPDHREGAGRTYISTQQAYIDGELCAVTENGLTSVGLLPAATDNHLTGSLIFFFDLLYLDGGNLMPSPLADRKQRLQGLLRNQAGAIRYCDHQLGLGPQLFQSACKRGLEGVVSKRLDAPYVCREIAGGGSRRNA